MESFAFTALLLTASNNSYTPTLPLGALIAWAICNSKKRQQFGGWLLYYYWQLYGGAIVTVLFLAIGLQNYVPESYDDSHKYYLFLASIVPTLLLLALEIAVATLLVSVRTWDLLRLLRLLMIAGLVAGGVATIIDANYFPDNLGFDFLTIFSTVIWLLYFFRSRRVSHVFKTHDWEIAVDTIYPVKADPVI